MSSRRPAALLLPLLLVLAACAGREEEPVPLAVPALPELVLPDAQVGSAYEVSLAASGGTAPLRYTVEGLPPGLTYDVGTGALSGSATQAGSYTLHVRVLDGRGVQDTRDYALQVLAPLQVTTTSLPAAQVGTAYRAQLAVAGGREPVQWTLVGGALPSGLALASDGSLSGTPGAAGTASFAVQARDAAGAVGRRPLLLEVRTAGGSAAPALRVVNWNLEWFGADKDSSGKELGPADETLQQANVRDVMLAVGADVWAVEEVVSPDAFASLEAQLPGYDGILSSDSARVPGGSTYYSASEQKLALLYRTDRVQVLGAQLLLTSEGYAFAYRPPLRVDVRVSVAGTSMDLTLIVVHLKALTGTEDYQRRATAAGLLKGYLDANLPTQAVLVLGDWNDDLDASISSGNPTPFRSFLDDPADYTFLTKPFTDANQGTTVSFSNAIDHQLATNELAARQVPGSTEIIHPAIDRYGTTTTDHYPVSSRFALPAP